MNKVVLLVVVLLLSFVYVVTAQGQGSSNCQNTINGVFYDLWGLNQKVGGKVQNIMSKGQTYYYLPCGSVSGEIKQCSFSYDTQVAVCQKDSRAQAEYHGCGTAEAGLGTPVWSTLSGYGDVKGFRLSYNKKGEPDRVLPPRSATIDFVCDATLDPGALAAKNPDEEPTHSYHLEWRTKYACGGSPPSPPNNGGGDDEGGLSVGWILIIVFFGLLVLYFLIGAGVQKFYFKSEGVEIIPNHGFWFAFPGLVKDGNVYTYRKISGLIRRDGGYSSV
eukprot:TRINITY_DN25554_c0_g1_i1.p1 TRINITY_DN25554_c0_g1~~TRINITY_DN25554_c0_g1_i1.p1  ORF type:complete len:275 (-),score=61.05 TRINITY_DN25554_c0_g1_i1:65-889(-)